MRFLTSLGAVLALGAALAQPAAAAPVLLDSFTHNYGTGAYDPSGSDALSAGHVTVSDQSAVRFSDSFSLASVLGDSIDSLALTLTFSSAGPSGLSFACGYASLSLSNECWAVRVQGANSSTQSDDYFATLFSALSPQTFVLSAATDTLGGVNAFATSLSTGTFAFLFSEQTILADKFNLSSAKLEVFGTPAAVPLPAGGLLLIGALGGLAALRRKRRA